TKANPNESESFSREGEREQWARNRGQNLSVRAQASASERIIRGRDFSGTYDKNSGKLPEISLEMRYAERLGVRLGDRLKFDVLGEEVEGEIVNIRRVKWTSF